MRALRAEPSWDSLGSCFFLELMWSLHLTLVSHGQGYLPELQHGLLLARCPPTFSQGQGVALISEFEAGAKYIAI